MAGGPVGVHESDCPFCAYLTGRVIADLVEPGLVSFQNEDAHAFPSLHQRAGNRGHHLVVPSRHTPDLYRRAETQHRYVLEAVRSVALAVRAAFDATGMTVMQHNEWDGGQDVFHMHFHVVPRHPGDGFYHGAERWPHGLEVVSLADRRDQASRVRRAMGASMPPLPSDVYQRLDPAPQTSPNAGSTAHY
jgi:histidine triad (HIT) family protein